MNIWQDFKNNDKRIVEKWAHYFPVYERHLSSWRNKTLNVIEIGVQAGGSLQLWQRFFGPLATIVGLDINPGCATLEEPGIHVRIGDQADTGFLQGVIDEFGAPDIVIDDGSHRQADVCASFEFLYPKLTKNGVYIVEDMHTSYWPHYGGGVDEPGSFINRGKQLIDELNAVHTIGRVTPSFFTRHTLGMSFYESMVVFERGDLPVRSRVASGNAHDMAQIDLTPPYMDPLGED
jgi:hypothetical protein